MRLEFHGAAKVNMGANTWAAQTGCFTGNPAHPGAAGTINLNLDPDYLIDDLECVVKIQVRGAMVASALTAFGYTRPSDAQIQVTCAQEQPGGAASILADVDFDISLWRIVPN